LEAYEYILNEILKLPTSKPTGTLFQIRTECPMCHNKDHKLYIGLMHDSKLLGYDCKQCPFSGKVGPEFLKLFDIKSDDYIKDFKDNRKNTKIVNPVTKMVKLNLTIPNYINPKDQFKVDYLSNRFQKTMTLQDLKMFKIVLNFKDFFEYNKFDYLQFETDTRKRNEIEMFAQEYSDHFVGMLSVDNNKINLRNIDSKKISKRYYVHVINKNIINPYMYMPDIPIDLMCKQPVINMAEGNYDIIGSKIKFFPNDDNSNIFVAVGTKKAYRRVLYQLLKMTGFLNAKINIFSDDDELSDAKYDPSGNNHKFTNTILDIYRDMFKMDRELFTDINIIYNSASKDFGNLSLPIVPVNCTI
jgi:hypothetical protein